MLRQADWGPVFVYGPMLLPAVWGELIGRVPEMAPWALMEVREMAGTGGITSSLWSFEWLSIFGTTD